MNEKEDASNLDFYVVFSFHFLDQFLAPSKCNKELQRIGVLKRKSYNETPPRVEYNLTDKGQELVESIINLLQWMRKWSSKS